MEPSDSLVRLRRIVPLRKMFNFFPSLDSSAASIVSIQLKQSLKILLGLHREKIHILLEWGN